MDRDNTPKQLTERPQVPPHCAQKSDFKDPESIVFEFCTMQKCAAV